MSSKHIILQKIVLSRLCNRRQQNIECTEGTKAAARLSRPDIAGRLSNSEVSTSAAAVCPIRTRTRTSPKNASTAAKCSAPWTTGTRSRVSASRAASTASTAGTAANSSPSWTASAPRATMPRTPRIAAAARAPSRLPSCYCPTCRHRWTRCPWPRVRARMHRSSYRAMPPWLQSGQASSCTFICHDHSLRAADSFRVARRIDRFYTHSQRPLSLSRFVLSAPPLVKAHFELHILILFKTQLLVVSAFPKLDPNSSIKPVSIPLYRENPRKCVCEQAYPWSYFMYSQTSKSHIYRKKVNFYFENGLAQVYPSSSQV